MIPISSIKTVLGQARKLWTFLSPKWFCVRPDWLSNYSFVVEDKKYNYVSARFPGDVPLLAEKIVAMVKANAQST